MALLNRSRVHHAGTFAYIWLMLGFATGTILLVGPVRWITSYLRDGNFSQSTENAVMMGVILLFVAVSALLAWMVVRQMRRMGTRRARLAFPAVLTIAAAFSLYGWTNPAIMASAAGGVGGTVTVGGGAEFVFGPYPDRPRLQKLKDDGFTAVVSLQHPAVLPFEPPGIAEETRATGEIGLTFIHAPMLPWISANDASLEKIRGIAKEGKGRYYVHCGLGRDRANVVKRMLEREGVDVAQGEGFKAARTFGLRFAEGNKPMERGLIAPLDEDVFLVPFPNKHEMFGNMLSGQVAHVLLVLDDANAEEREWIAEARSRFGEFDVPYSLETLQAGDGARAADLVRKAASLPRPLVIVVSRTEPHPNAAVAKSLLDAWKSARAR
ncbi:MAG: hypothetical protein M3R55_10460 [Acidobacteriota bacterium]|nr:hypothetical protein [Acidobacteriota bacterium]